MELIRGSLIIWSAFIRSKLSNMTKNHGSIVKKERLMDKMIYKAVALLLIFIGSMISAPLAHSADAAPAVAGFRVLQEALPKKDNIEGYVRKKPIGSTQTAMGMTTSEAAVVYSKKEKIAPTPECPKDCGENELLIEIKIADQAGMPFGVMAMTALQGNVDTETEDGYEKTVTVNNKYKAIEKAYTGAETNKECTLTIPVANRFLVNIKATGNDSAKLVHSFAAQVVFDKLEGLAAGK